MTDDINVTPFRQGSRRTQAISLNPFIYPDEWQDVCRRLLRAIAAHHGDRRRGTSIGMTALRRLIMHDYDRVEGGRLVEEQQLSRQNLETFLNSNSRLSGVKFAFVDKFIRTVQFDPDYEVVFREIVANGEREKKAVLAGLYQGHSNPELDASIKGMLPAVGKLYTLNLHEEVDANRAHLSYVTWRYVGLVIISDEGGVFDAIAIYSSVETEKIIHSQSHDNYRIYKGYLVPTSRYKDFPFSTNHQGSEAVLLLFRDEIASAGGAGQGGGIAHSATVLRLPEENSKLAAVFEASVHNPGLPSSWSLGDLKVSPYSVFDGPKEVEQLVKLVKDLTPEYGIW